MTTAGRSIVRGALLLTLEACAIGAGRGDRIDYESITRSQLEAGHFETVYDAVLALRPNWMSPRGTDSIRNPSAVVVYVDGYRFGDLARLREIHSFTVDQVHHYDGVEATGRWGIGHSAGAIQVTSFKSVGPGADSSATAPSPPATGAR